jgi:colanic acid biosynthesis glycosyl transferase WcaI
MKIGLLSQWFDPEPGPAAVPGVLGRGLAERGHSVRVLTGYPNYPVGRIYPGYRQRLHHVENPSPGIQVRRVPLYPSHDANPLKRVANYASFAASASLQATRHLGEADVAWVYNSPAPVGYVASRLSRKTGLPFLLHVMDVWPDSVLQSGMMRPGIAHCAAERGLTRMVQDTYAAAAAIAVTSPGQIELLASRGVAEERLHYVPVWADEDLFFPRPPDRTRLPERARDATLVVMYAGAMGHVQQLDTAVRAAAAARDEGVHLVMVGSGIAFDGLRLLARELDADNVHFMGSRPSSDMGDLTAAADLHLVALADTPFLRVTMPSKIQAIMASARPILASCVGDAAEVTERAGAGVVVTPGDFAGMTAVLRHLAAEPDLLRAWGRGGRRHYEATASRARAESSVETILREIAR